jgi:hypothetical protein
MTTSDQIARNVDLTFDLVRQALLRPDAADEISDLAENGALVYLDPGDSDLAAMNTAMADRLESRGEKIVRVEVQRRMFLNPVRG